MEYHRFDDFTRQLASSSSRRSALRRVTGGALAALGLVLPAVRGDAGAAAAPGDGPEGAACSGLNGKCGKQKKGKKRKRCCGGFSCKQGKCRCKGKTKPCRGECIDRDQCCTPDDCDGRACLNGICQPCLPGFKVCFLTCIPEDQCCLCTGGTVCQNGTCVCPSGTTECGNGVCKAGGPDGCCTAAECRAGEVCSAGRCQCPPGKEFLSGRCVRLCTTASDCPSGCGCRQLENLNVRFCSEGETDSCAHSTCQFSGACDSDELCTPTPTLSGCDRVCRRICPE